MKRILISAVLALALAGTTAFAAQNKNAGKSKPAASKPATTGTWGCPRAKANITSVAITRAARRPKTRTCSVRDALRHLMSGLAGRLADPLKFFDCCGMPYF